VGRGALMNAPSIRKLYGPARDSPSGDLVNAPSQFPAHGNERWNGKPDGGKKNGDNPIDATLKGWHTSSPSPSDAWCGSRRTVSKIASEGLIAIDNLSAGCLYTPALREVTNRTRRL
jgi:hypothetical protein